MIPDHIQGLLKKLDPLIQINRKLNRYSYGIKDPSTGKLKEEFTDREFNDVYAALSQNEFGKLKGGVCWDYTMVYNAALSRLGYIPMNIFIAFATDKTNIGGPLFRILSSKFNFYTHTVSIVEVDEKYVWVESAWKSHCGVYIADDLRSLFFMIVKELIYENNRARGAWNFSIHDYYEPMDPGTNGTEYLKYLMSSKELYGGKWDKKTLMGKSFTKLKDGIFYLESEFTEEAEDDSDEEIFTEATINHTFLLQGLLQKSIFEALDNNVKRAKYRQIQNNYIDRNAEKLATAGPQYLIVFGDKDHQEYLDLFQLTKEPIVETLNTIIKQAGSSSPFKFMTQHPMLPILYFCIRYFTLKKDEKAVNSTLGIYALDIYWTTYTKYFPKGVIEPVMAYTIDQLTDKFTIKKSANIFNTLLMSIQQSYAFHKKRFLMGGDDDVFAFAQRIKNDQNSLIRKIANKYMDNYYAGNAVTTRNDSYDSDNPIVDDVENATTVIQSYTAKVVPPMISNGIDIRLAMAAAKMSQISVTDCREYLMDLISDKHVNELESLVQSTLYIFLMNDRRSVREIKSQYFLSWGYSLFSKTNSKDKNIKNINAILDKWALESGIMDRYSSIGTRINYKKGIFIYIILTIQKYA